MIPLQYGSLAVGLTQGQVTSTYSPANGAQTTIVYEGTITNIQASALLFQANGWTTEITQMQKGGVWQMRVTYPEDLVTDNPALPQPIWTITPTAYQRNLSECQDLPWINLMTQDQIKAVLDSIRTKGANFPAVPAGTTASQIDSMNALYNLMALGVESRDEFYVTVQRTLVLPRYQVSNWLLTNNDKVLTKTALINNYQPDNATRILLPEGDTSIQTDEQSGISTLYGYLESPPTQTLLPNNRVQISQAWVYNKWIVSQNGSLESGFGLYEAVL